MTNGPRPPAQAIVGLDVGTTAVKAVAVGLTPPWRWGRDSRIPVVAARPRVAGPAPGGAAVLRWPPLRVTRSADARGMPSQPDPACLLRVGLDHGNGDIQGFSDVERR